MADNVLPFTGMTYVELPSDVVLEMQKGHFDKLMIIGWDKDEQLTVAGNVTDLRDILYLLEKSKMIFMKDDD